MAGESTDEEQVELIKQWLEKNGTTLAIGILVVLASVFGFRSWENSTRVSAEAASAIYDELTEAVVIGPLDSLTEEQESTGRFLATQLKTEYPSSAYGNFAAFHLAKIAVAKGDLDAAATELQWALDNSADDRLAVIANFRLARVKYGLEDFEGAIAQLNELKPGAHASSYGELEGDALNALGRSNEAREAYQRAINAQGAAKRPLTQMKLNDLVSSKTTLVVEQAGEAASDDVTSDDVTPDDVTSGIVDGDLSSSENGGDSE